MVKIEAIVRPERVNLVVDAVEKAGCRGFHLFNVSGRGRQKGIEVFTGRAGDTAIRTSLPKTLPVTVVPDEMQEAIVSAIIDAALSGEHGEIGDGKIFITQVADAIRVRTRERGESAI